MCEYFQFSEELLVWLRNIVAFGGVALILFFAPASYWVLGRPFDKKLNDASGVSPDFWFGWFSTLFLRPISYAVKIIVQTERSVENIQKSEFGPVVAERMDYGSFNFKKNATIFQKLFSYAYMGTLFLIVCGIGSVIEFCGLWGV